MNNSIFKPFTLLIFPVLLVMLNLTHTLQAQPLGEANWENVPQILDAIREPVFPDKDYIITDFGAEQSDALPAIREAIRTANEEGGGRVVIPEGEWLSKGPVHLKSNVNLHISENAVLRFSENPEDYLPQVLTRWEGTEAFNFSPLIYAYHVNNVAITGKGTIDGNAENGFGTWRDKQKPAQNRLREMGGNGTPVHERVFGLDDYLRPSMIQFFGSSQILIEDVTIHDSPMWVNHIIFSSHITVRGITVESYRLNNDGVAIDSSTLVLIENNSFSTGDDSIVIKSGRDQDAWKIGRPTEHVVVRNNYMEGHNALAIGSEMSGGARNIFMEDNQLGKVRSAIYFKSNLDRGGFIRNVRVRNIEVEEAEILLRFSTDYHSHRGGNYPAVYDDFVIENVTAEKANLAVEATGVAQEPIRNVWVKNLVVKEGEKDQEINHVENFNFENVKVNGKTIEVKL
ncbi:MAG: glycoside hydrolase family 28 protein [Balneolaceae bacterium]